MGDITNILIIIAVMVVLGTIWFLLDIPIRPNVTSEVDRNYNSITNQ